jgi:hypothetical protein
MGERCRHGQRIVQAAQAGGWVECPTLPTQESHNWQWWQAQKHHCTLFQETQWTTNTSTLSRNENTEVVWESTTRSAILSAITGPTVTMPRDELTRINGAPIHARNVHVGNVSKRPRDEKARVDTSIGSGTNLCDCGRLQVRHGVHTQVPIAVHRG